jgi:hypothetical protein
MQVSGVDLYRADGTVCANQGTFQEALEKHVTETVVLRRIQQECKEVGVAQLLPYNTQRLKDIELGQQGFESL